MGRVAVKIGANTFQYFTRNPRGGSVKELNVADIGNFMAFRKEHNLAMPLAHAPYTLNPCAAKPDVRRFAVETMKDDLGRLEYLPGSCYNFHPGSHVGQGAQEGIRKIAEVLNEVIRPEQKTTVLLETMAGKGSEVGRTFEELRSILDQVDPELAGHIGICMDTCHVWDSGYDIAGDLDGVLKKFDRTVGLERLKAIHLNVFYSGRWGQVFRKLSSRREVRKTGREAYFKATEDLLRQHSVKDCAQWAELAFSGDDICFDRHIFDHTVLMPFEHLQVPVPEGYDLFLRTQYGDDYMTPIQVGNYHGELVFDTEHSYREVAPRVFAQYKRDALRRLFKKTTRSA